LRIVLVSTYELGHQPFSLASPKAWLVRAGHEVTAVDLAKTKLPEDLIRQADRVAFSLPMHTATRLAVPVIERVKLLNPSARIACYGLYAPLNRELLEGLGVEAIMGGEFEPALVAWANGENFSEISLDKLTFIKPDRSDVLPSRVAYTEASRGCKHVCRHCPVVPVYQGEFRVVQRDVVLDDIRQQIAQGSSHVTFGDPDFFNGPTHAMRIAEALHAEFPQVTYDATIKIEHLLKHRDLLVPLRDTGCLFVTTAVESLDDAILAKLEKNHTRHDFFEVVNLARKTGLALQPTFIAFTPWTTIENYRELLRVLKDLELVENVSSIQLALRLLITTSSRLLELDDIRSIIGPFDRRLLVYPWQGPLDDLAGRIFRIVANKGLNRTEMFAAIWAEASDEPLPENFHLVPRAAVPYLDEPWYC
jgi:radical SAM superfamily enzyme YgiQ (UPF0313 family)